MMKAKSPWSESELDILKKLYPDNLSDILRLLPYRTRDAVHKRAKLLGLYAIRRWTDEEIEIMKKYYPVAGSNVGVLLKNKSRGCIQCKANRLNLKYASNPLSPEFQELLEKYREITENESAVFPNIPWTQEEMEILRKNYATMGYRVTK